VADHQLTPQPLPELGEVTALALGHDTTCALRSDGTVWCLGDDRHGQLGRGTSGSHSTQAAQIPGLEGVVQVAAGAANACARLRSGRVMCWGRRGDDKVDVPYGNLLVPTHVPGIEGAIDLAVGSTHLCVRRPGGRLDCAGSNFFGQLGDGTRQTFRELAVSTVDIGQVTGVAAANIHTCAVHAHGVSCWGGNFTGQLGDGTLRERPRPVSVAQLSR
jgi:alpha-tubulin suppressor-like RCC1 family protein